jgi:hypothetical protein
MMRGSTVLVVAMVVMMVVMCGGMVFGAGLALRRRTHRERER